MTDTLEDVDADTAIDSARTLLALMEAESLPLPITIQFPRHGQQRIRIQLHTTPEFVRWCNVLGAGFSTARHDDKIHCEGTGSWAGYEYDVVAVLTSVPLTTVPQRDGVNS